MIRLILYLCYLFPSDRTILKILVGKYMSFHCSTCLSNFLFVVRYYSSLLIYGGGIFGDKFGSSKIWISDGNREDHGHEDGIDVLLHILISLAVITPSIFLI